MAYNRADRRRKTALIKRKLERAVQQEVADLARWAFERGNLYVSGYRRSEQAIRRRRFKNEGRCGRTCFDCGSHACEWCLEGFYRKYLQRAQALEQDLQNYLSGVYDVLVEDGIDIPSARVMHLPRPMPKCPQRG